MMRFSSSEKLSVRVFDARHISETSGRESILERQQNWSSLMNVAPTLPEPACMRDLQKEDECMALLHAISEPTSRFWPLSRWHRNGRSVHPRISSADTTVFELSMEQILAPSLQAGQIVILDNLPTHTGAKVRLASRAHRDANSCFCHPTPPTFRVT